MSLAIRKPAALKPGDKITLVSPSSPIDESKLKFVLDLFHSEGYRTELAPNALATGAYLAGSDDEKIADLHYAFSDPDTKAVYCTRGGYGSARLLDQLDLDMMAGSGKMFLGFSDITSLHIPLNNRGLPTVHAPMGITLVRPRQEWVYESLRSVLRGGNPIPANSQTGQTIVTGHAEGIVTGGCLILLCDSLGTPNEVVFDDRIVIIEDVDEAPHRVDGMLTHLLNHGGIRRAAGIVMGEMSGTDERVDAGIGGTNWRDIVRERLAGLGIPFIIDFPFGHAANMLSLPLGIRAEMDADAGTLRYLEPLCQS